MDNELYCVLPVPVTMLSVRSTHEVLMRVNVTKTTFNDLNCTIVYS